MKRKEFTEEQIQEIINHYTIDIMGMQSIGKLFNVTRIVIKRILTENQIKLDTPGQRFKGGKKATRIRFYNKHKDKLKKQVEFLDKNKDCVFINLFRLANIRVEFRQGF